MILLFFCPRIRFNRNLRRCSICHTKQTGKLALCPEVGIRSLKDLTKDELIYCINAAAIDECRLKWALQDIADKRQKKKMAEGRCSNGAVQKTAGRTRRAGLAVSRQGASARRGAERERHRQEDAAAGKCVLPPNSRGTESEVQKHQECSKEATSCPAT